MNDTVSKNTTMSIVSNALLGFSGILSETSMNVTFPTLQKGLSLATVQSPMDYNQLPFSC